MGTNYYFAPQPPCECCGRPFEALHIGKSSVGWAFALHVIPEKNINTLDDWRRLWTAPGVVIRDEYSRNISTDEMEKIITNRKQNCLHGEGSKRGEGTWDYVQGEFS